LKRHNNTGIYYGYIIVAVCFCLQAVGWGIFNSLGVFLKPLMDEFAWPRSLAASTTSAGLLIAGTSAIFLGRLSDKYGPRLTMAVSGLFLGGGFMLLFKVETIWHMYLYMSLLVGIGVGGTDAVLLSTTTRWFVKHRGMMIGIVKVGTGVGMLVMPLLINYFIDNLGWRTAFVILGIVCLVTYVCGAQFLVRDPLKKGLVAYGSEGTDPQAGDVMEAGVSLKTASRSLPFWLIGGAFFVVFFCAATILIHVVPHAIDLGISPSNAAKILATVGTLSIAGRFVMGAAGDRIGNCTALIICFGFLTTGTIWLQFADNLWMLGLFAVVHGFAHGGFFALIAPILADHFGTRDQGVILGIIIFISNLGSAIGPILAGYIFDVTGSYGMIFMILSLMGFAGILVAFLLKPVEK